MNVEEIHNENSVSIHAVIVAGGSSTRMSGGDKMLASVLGKPLLFYSIQALNECHRVDTIAVVVSRRIKDDVQALIQEIGWSKVTQVIEGGVRRQDSVRKGLSYVGQATWVIVHDGARPCVGPRIFERAIDAAQETGSSVAAVPVTDTIKLADKNMKVIRTFDRDQIWAVQTPQVFRTDLLIDAHSKVAEDVSDDASMLEMIGGKVKIFDGSYSNIKVTTQTDLVVARAFLEIGSEKLEGLTLRPGQV